MKGDLVCLRRLEKRDLHSFYQAIENKEIRYMTGTKKQFTYEDVVQFYDKAADDSTRHDFAICLLNDQCIGDLAILEIDEGNKKAAFRIALHDPKYFNKGYGTEAVQLALDYAFHKLNLNRLQLEVYSHNKRGLKAYEKAGFKVEGVLREALFIDGKYSDEIIMGVLKREYIEKNKDK
ncbi:GNAT family N-acetyltransferase [Alkalihalophilus pseudofirmus]|uniref:GNAT family N-acetyltransferase n=1 Tax=Alkalihalophilus pseudofirmus TaxID=79885 RepID=UPI000951EE2F|nr:GNAT family N-acetyltransferase [Alkalihalophilus pseudofirmus]